MTKKAVHSLKNIISKISNFVSYPNLFLMKQDSFNVMLTNDINSWLHENQSK